MGCKIITGNSVTPKQPVRISATEDAFTVLLPADSTEDIVITFPAGCAVDLSKSVAGGIEFPSSFTPHSDIPQTGLVIAFDSVGSIYFPTEGKIEVHGSIIASPDSEGK